MNTKTTAGVGVCAAIHPAQARPIGSSQTECLCRFSSARGGPHSGSSVCSSRQLGRPGLLCNFDAEAQPRRAWRLQAYTAEVGSESDSDTESRTAFILANGIPDYYEVLGVDDDAPVDVIKAAYRALAKSCHPDFLGQKGHNICILLNEAYAILSDPQQRGAYNVQLEQALQDEDDTFTGKPLSRWLVNTKYSKAEDPAETRGVFVDECSCIGCKQCVWLAPATFRIEPDHGRSRVFAQWADTEDNMQDAIDSCPVDCIHWVEKDELAALEWVMQCHMGARTNVGMMMCGQGGGGGEDVFAVTASYMKKRQQKMKQRETDQKYSKAQAAARRKAAEQLAKEQQEGPWWSRVGATFGVSNFGAMAQSYVSSSVGEQRVGRRRRARPVAVEAEQLLSDGKGTIPMERSLVVSSSDEY